MSTVKRDDCRKGYKNLLKIAWRNLWLTFLLYVDIWAHMTKQLNNANANVQKKASIEVQNMQNIKSQYE